MPSRRKEMAQRAVHQFSVSIRLACAVFSISQSGYYYQPKLNNENEVIADWLIRLTNAQRNWGFGLCFYTYEILKVLHGIAKEYIESIES